VPRWWWGSCRRCGLVLGPRRATRATAGLQWLHCPDTAPSPWCKISWTFSSWGVVMVDVFISYKQEEREAVQIIASTLNDLKVAVWFDSKLRAGTSFDEEIAAALEAAKAVLVCWTP